MPRASEEPRMVPSDGVPLTTNTIIKWTSIVLSLVTGLISIVWFAAVLKADIITLQQELVSEKREATILHDQTQKDIDKLKDRADNTDKAVGELSRKLDVAVTILERIDKKVDSREH